MDYFVVGLGNKGERYKHTRHNVGWIVLDTIYSLDWEYDKYINALYAQEHSLHFLLPQTFMNRSGESVVLLPRMFSSFTPQRLVVIYDDIDLPLGTIRISFDRGAGGHNGVQSIIDHLGTPQFIRIRIGVAKTIEGKYIKPPVLGNFEKEELAEVTGKVSDKIKVILESLVAHGLEKTMNQYNG